MAIDVKFYIFSKKSNSTAQPSSVIGGNTEYITTFSCLIKDSSGIISPVISIQGGSTFNPAYIVGLNKTLNYAYIQAFGNRYYFVDEWTYSDGYWTASLRLDVLASWKSYIGATSAYVLRSASVYDDDIIDTLYATKAGSGHTGQQIDTEPYTGNTLVLGIIGQGGSNTTTGAVQYYAFTAAQAFDFMKYLMGDKDSAFQSMIWSGLNIVDEAIKATYNPFQYIASAMYFPVTFSGSSVSTIKLGKWSIPQNATLLSNNPIKIVTGNITIPVHPQGATRGKYLYCAPYSRYTLQYEPYGVIPLNSALMRPYKYVYCQNWIDGISGVSKLMVYATNNSATGPLVLLGEYEGQVGVPVQLAQLATNLFTPAMAAVSGTAVGAATGDAMRVLGSIGDAIQSAMPQLRSGGSNGSVMAYSMPEPSLHLEYYSVVNENDDHKGRPLCQEKTLNTLSGYIQVMDGEITAPASATELESIKASLEAGFFYE